MTATTCSCMFCPLKITKNGEWNSKWAMIRHIEEAHPKELERAKMVREERDKRINELCEQFPLVPLFKVEVKGHEPWLATRTY